MANSWILILLCCCSHLVSNVAVAREKKPWYLHEQEADRVTNLPGQPPATFRHYAGYVKLRPHDHKALFYWFFEAQSNVSQKPLVLWLNGGALAPVGFLAYAIDDIGGIVAAGPGCSSVAYGAAQELGPFLVRNNETQLVINKYSWNKVANMLFLEAPVGVGFSYTNNSEDLDKLGDQITAEDSHAFLINWFKRFPNFKSNDFYLAGESYAGHYVPQLAELIYDRNKRTGKDSYINLKGFMIGNAVINDETDSLGMVDYAWTHAIISDQLYYYMKKCALDETVDSNTTDEKAVNCSHHYRGFAEAYSGIDIYSIYTPVCVRNWNQTSPKFLAAPRFLTRNNLWDRLRSGYDPCTEDYAEKFFNREDVQKALHANVTKLSYPYTSCSNVIEKWNDSPETMLPIIHKLLNAGIRIWIYSGDTDGRVPVTSTRYSIKKLEMRVKEEWRAWLERSQVGGWVETYETGLVFATVRGAGHQVPVFAPQQSLSLFSHFLSSTPLPPSRF